MQHRWSQGNLTQAEAAILLGQCERSFRLHIERFEADGFEGLLDKRLSQISKRRASAVEVDHVVQLYKSSFAGWNVAHFHSNYKAELAGPRSYVWIKSVLQCAAGVKQGPVGTWWLGNAEGSTQVQVSGRFAANTGQVQITAAIAGLGICLQPIGALRNALASGELVQVLPGVASTAAALYVVYPSRRHDRRR